MTPPPRTNRTTPARTMGTFASLAVVAAVAFSESAARADEPKLECATLLEKASSFARFDATYPQARADLGECAAGRCSGNRALVDVCKAQLAKLDDAVPMFVKVIGAKAASGGAQILVDGEAPPAPTVQGNRGFRVKAGAHTIVVKAQGYKDARRDVTVDASGDEAARTFEVKLVTDGPAAGAPAIAAPAPPATTTAPEPAEVPTNDPPSSGFPYRAVGVTVGIVGLLGVGAGAVAGATAMSKRDEAGCTSDSKCPTDAQTSALLDAKNWGNASTIFMIAGGALAATGIVLFVAAPSKKSSVGFAPLVGPGAAGMFARGTF